MQALAHNPAVAEPHFVDAGVSVRPRAVPDTVDEENSDTRKRQEALSCHLFSELRGNHRQRGERLAFSMNENRPQGDQRFPCAARGDGAGRPLNVPALRDRGSRECLRRIRSPAKACQFGRHRFPGLVQRGKLLQDFLLELVRKLTPIASNILCNDTHMVRLLERRGRPGGRLVLLACCAASSSSVSEVLTCTVNCFGTSAHPRVSARTSPPQCLLCRAQINPHPPASDLARQHKVHAASCSLSSKSTEKPTGACQRRVWPSSGIRIAPRLSAWPIQPRKRFLVPFTNTGAQPMPIRGSIAFRCSSSWLNHSLHSARTGSPKRTPMRNSTNA